MATVRDVRRDLDERAAALAQRVLVSDAMRTFGTIGLPRRRRQSVLALPAARAESLSTTDAALIEPSAPLHRARCGR